MEKTDQQLIKEYLEGSAGALDVLVERHVRMIYNFVYRQMGNADEANDITQEVFVKIWKNIKKYDPKQSFKTWAIAIARNTSIDYLRKRKTYVFSDFDSKETEETFEETLVDREPLPDEIFRKTEIKGIIESLVAKLPENQRTAVILRNTEHMQFEEIARAMGKPLNTVKSYYRRALIAMRKELLGKNEAAPN